MVADPPKVSQGRRGRLSGGGDSVGSGSSDINGDKGVIVVISFTGMLAVFLFVYL